MRTELAVVCGEEFRWQQYYEQHFFSFDRLLLYSDSAVVSMPFGDMGTTFDALKVINSSLFSTAEHEFIVSFIVKQV